MRAPDLIFTNAKIWTADEANPWADSLAIAENRILAVGRSAEMPEGGKRIDLGGRLLLPGLWDAHIHFYYWSLGLQQIPLAGVASLAQMLERIAVYVASQPGNTWARGWGWNETYWEDSRLPHRRDLDRVTGSHRPAIFFRADMHSAVANTSALQMAGLMEPGMEVEGGVIDRDEDGSPTGVLRELAINLVRDHIPAPTGEHTDQAMLEGIARLHEVGITGICDQRMKDQEDGPKALAAMARLNRQGKLDLRVNCNIAAHNLSLLEALGLASPMGDERLRLGHVKVFADGTLGSRTAWMLEPFLGDADKHENCGLCLTPPEQIAEELRRAVEIGFPVSIHAIGDRANRSCLDLFEQLRSDGVEPPLIPHRIEHVQMIDSADLPRLAELGLTASVQPAHVLDDMDTADAYLGERAKLAYRFAELASHGTLLALGSDAPVADYNPFYGMHGAVYRQRPDRMDRPGWFADQCLTLEQTLMGYTLGAAQAAGWSRLTGSLAPGKRADFCVLDRDLFELVEQRQSLHETKVVMTLFDGQIVHNRLEVPALTAP
ncbi:MAG: amidohydrolase [Vulcanimicrobiota bacterium]